MLPINNALLRLSKRAETHDQKHLIDSFVDVGALYSLLSNSDNQILFGRRGTGKTHVLGYLFNEMKRGGMLAVQLDMRTIGSTGGIYSDASLPLIFGVRVKTPDSRLPRSFYSDPKHSPRSFYSDPKHFLYDGKNFLSGRSSKI